MIGGGSMRRGEVGAWDTQRDLVVVGTNQELLKYFG